MQYSNCIKGKGEIAMKITTFNPLIATNNAEDVIKLFEELGFEKRHAPVAALENGEIQDTRLKDANGNYVDVADAKDLPADQTIIRMNVDDFAEAYDILEKHGFKNTRGDRAIVSETSLSATMVSKSGVTISLINHRKEPSH